MPTRNIQVADDPAAKRHYLSEILATQDYPAIFARNGGIGLTKAQGKLLGLIQKYVVMPIGLCGLSSKNAGLE